MMHDPEYEPGDQRIHARIVRGSAFYGDASAAAIRARLSLYDMPLAAELPSPSVGFRCVYQAGGGP